MTLAFLLAVASISAEPVYASPQCEVPKVVAAEPAPQADPYGFLAWLNAERARRGLHALAYSPSLSSWALANCYRQAAAGFSGHWVNPGVLQASFFGPADAISAGMGWMASPSHAAILMSPSITSLGIAGVGASWTVNAQ